MANAPLVKGVGSGEAVPEWGLAYGRSLYLPLNFAVNPKLLSKQSL